ncbi:MAG: histidine kinase [Actinomycetota bacterium]
MSATTGASIMAWLRADVRRFDLVVAVAVTSCALLLMVGTPDQYDQGWPDVVISVGAFVVLVLRSRWPRVLFGIAALGTTGFVAVYQRPTLMIFASLVLLATVCVRLERWPAVGLGAVSAVGLYAMGLHISEASNFGDAQAVIFIAWAALAVGVADAVRSWRRAQQLAEAQLRTALLATEAQTRQYVSEERLTIARELHDLLAHNLSVMNVQTGVALHLLRSDPDEAEQSLVTARDAGRNVLDELRELLSVLRGDGGDEAPTSSLPTVDQLADLVATMEAAGLDVRWTRNGTPRPLAPAVSLASYRIVQEALTNAAKHGSGVVDLFTDWESDRFVIRASNPLGPPDDNGVGTGNHHLGDGDGRTAGRGHGLIGMRERAVANGGRLTARNVDGSFVVDGWLPATVGQEVEA